VEPFQLKTKRKPLQEYPVGVLKSGDLRQAQVGNLPEVKNDSIGWLLALALPACLERTGHGSMS